MSFPWAIKGILEGIWLWERGFSVATFCEGPREFPANPSSLTERARSRVPMLLISHFLQHHIQNPVAVGSGKLPRGNLSVSDEPGSICFGSTKLTAGKTAKLSANRTWPKARAQMLRHDTQTCPIVFTLFFGCRRLGMPFNLNAALPACSWLDHGGIRVSCLLVIAACSVEVVDTSQPTIGSNSRAV